MQFFLRTWIGEIELHRLRRELATSGRRALDRAQRRRLFDHERQQANQNRTHAP